MTDGDAPPAAIPKTPEEWYTLHKCQHVHCPFGCEHPQERLTTDGRMLCWRCWVVDGVVTEVLPCVPGVCND